ncbi:MAG: type II secretion system major pseudopilin GspG [Pirellulaceae bacterium]
MIRRRNRRRRRGFTLMEVLLVLAILVVLGSLVTVGYFKIQQGAYADAAKNQIRAFDTAIQGYTLAIGTPPSTEQGLDALLNAPSDLRQVSKWRGPYLGKDTLPLDPWGNGYQYELIDASQATFRIWSNGPDNQAGTEDDVDPSREVPNA